jgi:hypothetical protein
MDGERYYLGGKNEKYQEIRQKASRVRSVKPTNAPPVEITPGYIESYMDYQVMLEYYLNEQARLLDKNDKSKLKILEKSFSRTIPAPPKLEDFSNETLFRSELKKWVKLELDRAKTNYSPHCLPAARKLLGWKSTQRTWNKEYANYVRQYEQSVMKELNKIHVDPHNPFGLR